ncbi:hypothetical protein Tco_0154710 [Tanacetum coccineum]
MPTEMELTLEQTQQGVSYEVSNIRVNSFTMKMEILLEPTSNKLMVEHAEYDESNTYVLERFNTTAGNPVKKILLKLNLSDHRILKDGGGVKEVQRSFRHSDTDRLSRSDEVLKLKNFKKDATLKLFKSTNQERRRLVVEGVLNSNKRGGGSGLNEMHNTVADKAAKRNDHVDTASMYDSGSSKVAATSPNVTMNYVTIVNSSGLRMLRKRVAYPLVENYVKNTWSKYGLVKLMMNSSSRCTLLKEDAGNVLIWGKFHHVPSITFIEDKLSVIATKLGTPLMFESYTSVMCTKSWGRSSYVRVMIELQVNVESKDTIVVAVLKFVGEGFSMCTIRIKYEWKPPRCSSCKAFGYILDEYPKKIISNVLKNVKNPRQDVTGVQVGPKQEVSSSNPFDALNTVENDHDFGMNEGNSKLVEKGGISDGVSSSHRTSSKTFGSPNITL